MRLIKLIFGLVLLAGAFAAGYLFRARPELAGSKTGERPILYWYDPMHPAYRSDKPGIAPDCGMQLVAKYSEDGNSAQPGPERKVLYYRDPQQPAYRTDKPGLNPETGNDLAPVYEGDPSTVPLGTVQIPADKQQLIGLKTAIAEVTTEGRTIRAAGRVMADETQVSHVHSRTEGWVDQVFVDFTGKFVSKGQPLLTIYSPELVASQQEYLLALRAKEQLRQSTVPEAAGQIDSLIEAARKRLELWNLTAGQIEEITRTRTPIRAVTLYSPATGFVTARNAFPNTMVKPDVELYTIVDLGRVWLVADVFQQDASQLRVGSAARASIPGQPGKAWNARASYIHPQVDPVTRTIKVRLEAPNPDFSLKPEMFVEVEFAPSAAARLTVPVDAVLDSGERTTVFVQRESGYFEPRQVRTGERFADRVVILSGLSPGERVVTNGTFLIDSESRLKAAASGHEHD
jgi:RND family efflux transporter MFP subunit